MEGDLGNYFDLEQYLFILSCILSLSKLRDSIFYVGPNVKVHVNQLQFWVQCKSCSILICCAVLTSDISLLLLHSWWSANSQLGPKCKVGPRCLTMYIDVMPMLLMRGGEWTTESRKVISAFLKSSHTYTQSLRWRYSIFHVWVRPQLLEFLVDL